MNEVDGKSFIQCISSVTLNLLFLNLLEGCEIRSARWICILIAIDVNQGREANTII